MHIGGNITLFKMKVLYHVLFKNHERKDNHLTIALKPIRKLMIDRNGDPYLHEKYRGLKLLHFTYQQLHLMKKARDNMKGKILA